MLLANIKVNFAWRCGYFIDLSKNFNVKKAKELVYNNYYQ